MLNTNNAFVSGQQDVDTPHGLLGEVPSLSQDAQCVVDSLNQSADSDVPDTDNERELFGTESRHSIPDSWNHVETGVHDVSMADESIPLSGETCSNGGTLPTGNDMLLSLVTNWPCVVCTVLGFYVAKQQSKGEVPNDTDSAHRLSPVHLLDSFTADLVLNGDRATVVALVTTIVDRMNKCLESPNCPPLDTITFTPDGLTLLSEETQALFVGKRFLGSVVRVLALEHSRVKNTFSELRERGAARGVASGNQGGSRVGTALETLR